MPRKCMIITGPSGANLSGSVQKLARYLHASSLPLPHVVKIEDHMIGFDATNYAHRAALLSQPGGLRHLLVGPKQYLRKLWAEACEQALKAVPSGPELLILIMHAAFYHNVSEEFFSCVDPERLDRSLRQHDFVPSFVVTLVDDCYDVLARLTEKGQVLHPVIRPGSSRFDALAEVFLKLALILDWRASEVSWADYLARELRINHYVIAVKHPLSLVRDLIFTTKKPVYISHPITGVRELLRQGSKVEAHAIMEDIQRLTLRLRQSEVVTPFSPTAIDELRISRHGDVLAPRLEDRWPIDPHEQLLFSPPLNPMPYPLDPYAEEGNLDKSVQIAVSGLLGLLAMRLKSQINWRDRKLVEQSQGLVVFRPYYRGKMSFGVLEEIRHRNTLQDHGVIVPGQRPCVAVNPASDFAMWKPEYVKRKLKDLTLLEDGAVPSPQVLEAARRVLETSTEVLKAAERRALDGTILARTISQAVTLRFRGTPGFGGPLDGVQATLQEAWTAGEWQKLAEDANQTDWIGEQLRSYDAYITDNLSTEEFVRRVEEVFK